jgi:hypothetical protein
MCSEIFRICESASVNVRFAPKATELLRCHERTQRANSDLTRRSKQPPYSITLSARASSIDGTSRPSAFAVFRLMTNSKRVACSMGRSAGFAPCKILSMSAIEDARCAESPRRTRQAYRLRSIP